jgi:hypothetical protein
VKSDLPLFAVVPFISITFLVLLIACSPAPTPTEIPASAPTLGATPTIKVYAAATPTPVTIDAIAQITKDNPSFLASQHLARGLQCQTCHSADPMAQDEETKICLSCHGGSYDAVAALTPGTMNPHRSHRGQLPCAFCHFGHKPFVSQCSQCKH